MRKDIWALYPRICHYTRYDTVFKIIESRAIWATHFSHLNDTSELYYSEDLISQAVHEQLKKDFVISLEEVRDLLRRTLYAGVEEGVYLTSFCKLNAQSKENDGILSMWRSYGNDGCYIEFDSKLIDESLVSVDGVFDEVFYHGIDDRQQEYADLAAEIAHKTIQLIEGIKEQGLLVPFMKLAPMLKHPGFHEEKEVRLVILNSLIERNDISFPVKQNCLGKDYIAIPFDPKAIKKIVIGPNKAQKYMMDQISKILQSMDEYKHVEVACSTIPYRGWN